MSPEPRISQWLRMTRWPRYLQGHKSSLAAPLTSLPIAGVGPLLDVFVASLDRLVDQARDSFSEQRVSVFDQALIKRVFPEHKKHRTPALLTLRGQICRKDTGIWAWIICFAYQTFQPWKDSDPMAELTHRITKTQASNLQNLTSLGRRFL